MEHLIKINLPGGVASAGDLYEILVIAENAGARHIRFGNRQQLFFTVDAAELEDMELEMLRAGTSYEIDADEYPNIMSSYVCDAIFNHESWLREGVYKDIFDLFNYQPQLKINLIDRHQSFIPFFSGNFNFISSDVSNYWYLHIRFPKTNQFYCWPSLIYSDDIPTISKRAEDVILKNKSLFYDAPHIDEQLFFEKAGKTLNIPAQPLPGPLQLPDFYLPYYEGFNRYANKYWLGIYRRNELFDIGFLKDVCNLCLKTRIGQLYTTPWKSILIKGIEPNDRNDWGYILDKYRLNIRHASNELNWQIEDMCEAGLALKQQLVREFEEADLRTYRLSFAIKTQPKTGLLGSIIIKTQPSGAFEVLHTVDFNPNSKNYISYRKRIRKENLVQQLTELCNSYYQLSQSKKKVLTDVPDKGDATTTDELLYSCKHCMTVYDKTYGDASNDIPAGTAFEDLGVYICPVCESEDSFELIDKR
ncbi:rubredoxin [Mucilaginibacter mali]|uniref:Rubredoxin n=1 Tax=Mucilaginibacter mali TaxID=2740462 RepID=A0A7D4UE15_9SPHI|nr:rubredoxin [Mucilaginibacter mali]QKJ31099.1 rubredoxin [Mucilaginibacter mali]